MVLVNLLLTEIAVDTATRRVQDLRRARQPHGFEHTMGQQSSRRRNQSPVR